MANWLIDGYQAVFFDLDGVVYLGPNAVDGAVAGIADLDALGVRIAYVTNNAARPPETVAAHLQSLGINCSAKDIVTSAQASVRMLAEDLPVGTKILVAGTEYLADEVRNRGFQVVYNAEDAPFAVLQGYDPTMTEPRLDEAAYALQNGAVWYATNTDPSRPTNRGLVPGAGAQISAVGNTVSISPKVAGKPYPPLLQETIRRVGTAKAIVVGDRLDTDIEGANSVGMDSLFVFTGAHGAKDLLKAPLHQRPTAIGWDLRALLAPGRRVRVFENSVSCGQACVVAEAGAATFTSIGKSREEHLDALWALAHLVWQNPDLDYSEAVSMLGQVR